MCLFQIWFPRCVCPEVGLLGHMAVLFPIFYEISTLFSIVAILVCIPTNSVRGFPFLHTLSSIYCQAQVFNSKACALFIAYSLGYSLLPRCSSYFYSILLFYWKVRYRNNNIQLTCITMSRTVLSTLYSLMHLIFIIPPYGRYCCYIRL